jgi:enoyl-CoA hydratase/carnithine racemase
VGDSGLRVQTEDGVRSVTLDRPHRLNAFTAAGYRTLAAALRGAAGDDDVRVVVLLGAGRSFCAGVDLTELAALADTRELSAGFSALLHALAEFPKPLLAGVQGAAVGFGATILLHVDVVLAADDARLRLPFTRLGTAPEAASSVLLPRLVGHQRAAELLFTSRWIPAEEARELGLVARCCPPDRLHAEVMALAREIAGLPGPAVQAAKRLLRAGWSDAVGSALAAENDAAAALHSGFRTSLGRSAEG